MPKIDGGCQGDQISWWWGQVKISYSIIFSHFQETYGTPFTSLVSGPIRAQIWQIYALIGPHAYYKGCFKTNPQISPNLSRNDSILHWKYFSTNPKWCCPLYLMAWSVTSSQWDRDSDSRHGQWAESWEMELSVIKTHSSRSILSSLWQERAKAW